jgi:hypothetical protein
LEDLTTLGPAQLLIAQFAPGCTQLIADQAASLFFLKAASFRRAQQLGGPPPLAEFRVGAFKLEKDTGGSTETDALALIVSAPSLTVLQDLDDDLFVVEGSEITGFKCASW